MSEIITTSPPNPQLVEVLMESPEIFDWKTYLDSRMNVVIKQVMNDTFGMRATTYSRQTFTIALLLAGDNMVRDLAQQNNVDLRAFDNAVGQMQQLILVNANKPAPAIKVANALRKLVGL